MHYDKWIWLIKAIKGKGGGGGGGEEYEPVTLKTFNFFDYDGTLLLSYTGAEIAAMTELPALPIQHEELEFDGWNWTLEELKAVPMAFVGALYQPKVGSDSKIPIADIEVVKPGAAVTAGTTYVEKDWGDGTISSEITHTYTKLGKYKIRASEAVAALTNSTGTGYGAFLTKVYTHYDGIYRYRTQRHLQDVAFGSDSILDMKQYFKDCSSLKHATLPRTVTQIGASSEGTTFSACYSLFSLCVPPTVTKVLYNAFTLNTGIPFLILPPAVDTIQSSPLGADGILVVMSTTPPSLYNNRTLGTTGSIPKIYVPDDSVATYKAATNWSTYAGLIYPISDLITELEGGTT